MDIGSFMDSNRLYFTQLIDRSWKYRVILAGMVENWTIVENCDRVETLSLLIAKASASQMAMALHCF